MAAPEPAFWDALAETYAQRPVEDPAAFERKIAFTQELMTPDSVVLDVGCGTGSLALRLSGSGKAIHGVDFSSAMIRIARAKRDAAGAANVTFHIGAFDGSFATFDAGSLDGVCAYALLHLVADREATLAHMFKLLKPGGFLVSSTLCLGDTWAPHRPLLAVMRWMGKAPMVHILSAETLIAELRGAGFEDVRSVDVGAKATIAFIAARKPAGRRSAP